MLYRVVGNIPFGDRAIKEFMNPLWETGSLDIGETGLFVLSIHQAYSWLSSSGYFGILCIPFKCICKFGSIYKIGFCSFYILVHALLYFYV